MAKVLRRSSRLGRAIAQLRCLSWKTIKGLIWFEKAKLPSAYRGPNFLEALNRGSEVRPVWVPCPLPSPGDHKLACCNSLPDGLAPSRCVFVYMSVNKGVEGGATKVRSACDLRRWECRLGRKRAA